ncbi:MAG: sulfate adenylyltransferase [Rubrivivax sp.]|nr:sulfate adenylyltransferase [Rubrivivax sp.]
MSPAVHKTAHVPARRVLRFLTAGSVDDGKSTLIGRLLLDSRAILADQLDHLHAKAEAAGEPIDLSLLTDGLEAEREQGITIDVAYRYFTTPRRKFIIADAPGHEQYTRNMVTAAAGSDAAVVLVDITKLELDDPARLQRMQREPSVDRCIDLLPQTRRHALLAQLLRVPSIVFAVNKLDAVADPGAAFAAVSQALQRFADQAQIAHAGIVPVSALRGDNVTQPMGAAWYTGPTLLQLLEGLPTAQEAAVGSFSLPVQYVAREGDGTGVQPRVLWGRIAQGQVQVGDAVQVFPSGEQATVTALRRAGSSAVLGQAGQSIGVVLDRPLDVSRGDWLAAPGSLHSTQRFAATLAWLDTEAATPGRRYWLRHGNRWVQARLCSVEHRLDIHTLAPLPAEQLEINDIGEVVFELQQPLPLSTFADNRVGGALIVVDPASHRTSGALLVRGNLGG